MQSRRVFPQPLPSYRIDAEIEVRLQPLWANEGRSEGQNLIGVSGIASHPCRKGRAKDGAPADERAVEERAPSPVQRPRGIGPQRAIRFLSGAAKRRQIAAHGASRGNTGKDGISPEGAKDRNLD